MSVGTNIRKRRYELRLSQQELADALGYKTRSTIAKIESGENDLTQRKLARFAEALDTTVEALITGGAALQRLPDAPAGEAAPAPERPGGGRTAAVILAGGKSSRNRQNIPSQFIHILGKPVIVYCLEAYQAHPAVDEIYIVCLKGWDQIVEAYAEQYRITKLKGLIPGGPSGILSVRNAVEYLSARLNGDDIVILQEATRPMVTVDMISKLLQATYENGSANICHPMRDYMQFAVKGGKPAYVDRDTLVELQSPEAYRLNLITGVFEEARRRGHSLTESTCAMLRYTLGRDINFIEGSVNNIKIVRQEDIAVFEALVKG
ncbi:MAG: XRE family transcriptional regulator [Clostridia bacterium]|nr:XRE family transcriptional regulator [Clostridia bacterium]